MKKILNYFDKYPLQFIAAYWIVYLLLFMIVERVVTTPTWIVHSTIDDLIPFTKYAIPGYYLWFIALVYTSLKFLFEKDHADLKQFYIAMIIGTIPTLIFYFIVPNGLNMRPASVEGNDIFALLVRLTWMADNSNNVCPSIHVLTTVLMDMAWQRSPSLEEKRLQKGLCHLAALIIILATMLLKQHSIIDVIAGLLVGIIADRLATYLIHKAA